MKKVKILDVQFDVCTRDEALARIFNCLETRTHEGGKHIVTPNPEMLLEAQKNPLFRDVLNHAWLSIPDGIGILWASTFHEITKRSGKFARFMKGLFSLPSLIFYPKFIQKIFPERITGVDLMQSVCAMSREKKNPIFLLGAAPGAAEKVKEMLEVHYHGVPIVGTFSGSPSEDDFLHIQAMIAETRPTILFVAYGAPAQELWIFKHLKDLPSVKIAMGVGGAFDFIAGVRKRAPKLMQRTGTEWLYRLVQEPKRIKRIWNACVKFPAAILKKRGDSKI